MTKVRLGGIKVLAGRSHLTNLCPADESALHDVCRRMAADGINLSFLTHLCSDHEGNCYTAACTEIADAYSGYFHWKAGGGSCHVGNPEPDVNILSIFPHNQNPLIAGTLIQLIARQRTQPRGFASSPSAISVLIRGADTSKAIDGLFDLFEFPTHRSPLDWHAAYEGQEHVLKEIICSFQEDVIKVYDFARQAGFELWNFTVSGDGLEQLGKFLTALGKNQARSPFLVGHPDTRNRTHFSICLPEPSRPFIEESLSAQPFAEAASCAGSVAVVSLHGPHFGDRFGIVHALLRSLEQGRILPLALCCVVSTISLVVAADELPDTLRAIETSFQIPHSG
ncbi:MAG TPA: hypothetical protein PLM79_06105 [Syntrophobacteraceae bacterium]|nr:hypothetical protein [Syntrophobacteraceae bacterium]